MTSRLENRMTSSRTKLPQSAFTLIELLAAFVITAIFTLPGDGQDFSRCDKNPLVTI
jgi:prepilin-type N-terminal cleavage/methylation domain-containing protein